MARVQQVTLQDFSREVVFSPDPVVVDVYADWCGPCRVLAPLLERAAVVYSGRIKFVKVNVDKHPEVAEVYRVNGVPTLLFFRNGRLTDRVIGLSDLPGLIAKFDRFAPARPTVNA